MTTKREIQALREQRAKVVADQRAMLDRAKAAGRELNPDEALQYRRLDAEFDDLGREIDLAEREDRLSELTSVPIAKRTDEVGDNGTPRWTTRDLGRFEGSAGGGRFSFQRPGEFRTATARAFDSFVAAGLGGMGLNERRALQADSDVAGGYLVLPRELAASIILSRDNMTFVRGLATKFEVPNAASLGVPALDNDVGDPTWTTELSTGSEDSEMDFGLRELVPHPLAVRVKASNKLLRCSPAAGDFIVGRLLYKGGVVEEFAYLTGSGAGQPLGVFTASDQGIPTSRDVSTGNTATHVKGDGLFEAEATLKAQYRTAAVWCFHRAIMKQIRQLKDGEGSYLWQPGLLAGQPNRLLGYPVYESEYAPSTTGSGNYAGILGDFSYYYIADALTIQVRRLDELYAETDQVGFILRLEADGMPALAEAFARVKFA